MKNINQRRKYSHIKWMGNKETRFAIGTALHEAKDRYVESLGATVRTGGEDDFIKLDRKELADREIARYNRILDKLYNKHKKTEGFTETMERLNKISLTSPEESSSKS